MVHPDRGRDRAADARWNAVDMLAAIGEAVIRALGLWQKPC